MRVAFDTNVWRYTITDKTFAKTAYEIVLAPLAMPAVVMFELLKISHSKGFAQRITVICESLRHVTVAPSIGDWATAARVSTKVRERWGYEEVGLHRLQNDTLIAVTCARLGWTLVTANRSGFERVTAVMGVHAPRVVYLAPPL